MTKLETIKFCSFKLFVFDLEGDVCKLGNAHYKSSADYFSLNWQQFMSNKIQNCNSLGKSLVEWTSLCLLGRYIFPVYLQWSENNVFGKDCILLYLTRSWCHKHILATQCWSKSLWLVKISHITWNSQFQQSKFFYDINSPCQKQLLCKLCHLPAGWPDKNRQMSIKFAQKWFH